MKSQLLLRVYAVRPEEAVCVLGGACGASMAHGEKVCVCARVCAVNIGRSLSRVALAALGCGECKTLPVQVCHMPCRLRMLDATLEGTLRECGDICLFYT